MRIFEAVARLENVSQASVEVHLSQPAVTQAIRNLERGLGATLFERRHTGTYLTPSGEIFRRRCQRMFEQMDSAIRDFRDAPEAGSRTSLHAESGRITRAQMRCFAAIALGGSLAHAARSAGMSQTSLHRAVRELESRLGKPLYRHTASGITATDAGAELARRITIAAREIECAIDEIKEASGESAGSIAIGAQMMGSSFFVGDVANDFVRQHPDARMRIVNDSFDVLMNLLRSGNIDYVVGLIRDAEPAAEVAIEPLFGDPYRVVGRRGHPLANARKVTREDLARFDWVVPLQGAARRVAYERLFGGVGKAPKSSIETHSLSAIRAFLADSDRLTLLTQSEISFDERLGVLTTIPYGPLEPPAHLGLTTRAGWLPTRIQLAFLESLRAHAQTQSRKATTKTKAVALKG